MTQRTELSATFLLPIELKLTGVGFVSAFVISWGGFLFDYSDPADYLANEIAAALGSRLIQDTPGSENLDNSINWSASVTIKGPPAPTLQVNSAGQVTQLNGISATDGTNALSLGSVVTSGKIVVNDLNYTSSNKLDLDYPAGRREIIVISDGSEDRTEEIVRSFNELPVLDDRSADEIIGYNEHGHFD